MQTLLVLNYPSADPAVHEYPIVQTLAVLNIHNLSWIFICEKRTLFANGTPWIAYTNEKDQQPVLCPEYCGRKHGRPPP